jgi:spore cortex formation protein SpoVR/YcgB (stage V sporulation)
MIEFFQNLNQTEWFTTIMQFVNIGIVGGALLKNITQKTKYLIENAKTQEALNDVKRTLIANYEASKIESQNTIAILQSEVLKLKELTLSLVKNQTSTISEDTSKIVDNTTSLISEILGSN